jgi:hypothetical protein
MMVAPLSPLLPTPVDSLHQEAARAAPPLLQLLADVLDLGDEFGQALWGLLRAEVDPQPSCSSTSPGG